MKQTSRYIRHQSLFCNNKNTKRDCKYGISPFDDARKGIHNLILYGTVLVLRVHGAFEKRALPVALEAYKLASDPRALGKKTVNA